MAIAVSYSVGNKESKGYPVYVRAAGWPTVTVSFHKTKELAQKRANTLRKRNK